MPASHCIRFLTIHFSSRQLFPVAISLNSIESLFKVDENHMQIGPEFLALLYDDSNRVIILESAGRTQIPRQLSQSRKLSLRDGRSS